jgi:O-antigen/teichoic acid export membrane protein
MKISAVLGFVTNLARACAACAMLLIVRHATAAEWACMTLAISALAAAAAVMLISIRFGRPRFALSLVLKHGAEGLGYAFATSTSAVYNDIDKTMLCHYGMNVANAIYSIAYRVVDVATIPFFAVREAMLPRLFQIGRKGIEEPARHSLKMLMFTLPMAALSAMGMLFAAPLIPVLLGKEFTSSVSALRWLCWIPIFRSVHHMTGGALTGAGLQPYRTSAQLGAAVLNLLLNLWLIPPYGWRGAAYASVATDGLLAVSCWVLLAALRASERRKESRENDRICVLCRPVEID